MHSKLKVFLSTTTSTSINKTIKAIVQMAKLNILTTKEPEPRARAKKEAQKPRKNIKAIGPHKR